MQKSNKLVAIVLIFAGAAFLIYYLSNKGDAASKEFEKGSISGGKYRNDYFGFTFPIPDGWQVVDESTMKRVQKEGSKAIGKENPKLKSVLERGSEGITLLMISKGKQGSRGNINILLKAYEISPLRSAITDGGDFLEDTLSEMQSAMKGMRVISSIAPTELDDEEFHNFEYEFTLFGRTMHQRVYAKVVNRHVLAVSPTGFNNPDMHELTTILKRIRFEN